MKFILLIGMSNPASNSFYFSGVFPTLDQCLQSLRESAVVVPTGNAENEWAGLEVCLPEEKALANYKGLIQYPLW